MGELTYICADTRDPIQPDLGDRCPGCYLEGLLAGCIEAGEVVETGEIGVAL